MLEKNNKYIENTLKKKDLVLDIGGWARPFNRANFVIDIHPYETRGFFGSQGGKKEFFNKKSWIIHDISSKKRLPFKNKSFDFVICSHTLEDIRDPIFLCSEIIRVGKSGYIEVPSELLEVTKGIANKKYCGYYHHRWLVNIKNNHILFRFKPHFIHSIWKFHLPKRFARQLDEHERVSYLFWKDYFEYAEIIQISRDKVQEYIERLVRNKRAYPKIYYSFYRLLENLNELFDTIKIKFFPKSYKHKYMNTGEYISK